MHKKDFHEGHISDRSTNIYNHKYSVAIIVLNDLIASKVDYKEYLERDRLALGIDLRKMGRVPIWHRMKTGEKYYIWRYQKLLRKVEYLQNCLKGRSFIWKIDFVIQKHRLLKLGMSYSFYIQPNCFGPGLSIAHIGTIIVHGKARIGQNCRIHNCVTIGGNSKEDDQVPTIGDNVFIGPSASILGGVVLADGIAVGANAVVLDSFPQKNITIAGAPARKVSETGSSGLLHVLRKKEESPVTSAQR